MPELIHQIQEALGGQRKLTPPADRDIKIYYGCGTTDQPGYVNVDVRDTEATDIVAALPALATTLKGCCNEVYLSHVLEHFGSPGKRMRKGNDDVLGALLLVKKMLKKNGVIRIAVPDFSVLCRLYVNGDVPLYPRLLGRISGEQEYPENLHRCVFDRDFLGFCLSRCGFTDIETWDPLREGFHKDSSFDQINGINVSLNLKAYKRGIRLSRYFKGASTTGT